MPEVVGCQHERMKFGSGGFYVKCLSCPALWAAVLSDGRSPDVDRANDGIDSERVDQRFTRSGGD